jgi:hypothetical protein
VSSRIAVLDERWEDAERDVREGLATIRTRELPFQEALVLVAYGDYHAARGEVDAARQRYDEALAIYRRLGAVPWVRRVEGERAALAGVR